MSGLEESISKEIFYWILRLSIKPIGSALECCRRRNIFWFALLPDSAALSKTQAEVFPPTYELHQQVTHTLSGHSMKNTCKYLINQSNTVQMGIET